MIVTFDNKAKEIIKNIVTEGDTPEPTPSKLEFDTLSAGTYKINADKFLELLIAKGIDVDYENPGSNDEIYVGVNVDARYEAIDRMYLNFNEDSGYPQLYIYGFNGYATFKASTELSVRTIRTSLEAFSTEDLTFTISKDLTYIPLFISTINDGYTRLALTADEIKTFIIAE